VKRGDRYLKGTENSNHYGIGIFVEMKMAFAK